MLLSGTVIGPVLRSVLEVFVPVSKWRFYCVFGCYGLANCSGRVAEIFGVLCLSGLGAGGVCLQGLLTY